MNFEKSTLIGGAWLVASFQLELVMPLVVISHIGTRRATRIVDSITTETYVERMRPPDTLRGHLAFHLKHEVPHLELLSRLFEQIDPNELVHWINDEPSGQYAKRAGFLFEFLSNQTLNIDVTLAGGYIDVLDSEKLVTATPGKEVVDKRWRVRNNLPGTRDFCPVVRKTPTSKASMALNLPALIENLEIEFGKELLMRSAVWMTLRESKSSFAIEGESDQADRIQRFADVLSRRTGQDKTPFSQAFLAQLQSDILGQRTSLQKFGIRQSPVFVGEVIRYQEVVHYIAPPARDIAAMLEGLATFLDRTEGQSAIMRSAVAAFGFVYIHPLADGNGRIHRFLIHDVLRRDGVVKDPMILPVSSFITSEHAERRAYDQVLDVISQPLMQTLAGLYAFNQTPTQHPDGIHSNFVFHGEHIARHAWRALDLTPHVSYLAHVLEHTITQDMREESRYMRSHALARRAIKDILEMPDLQIDRVIRSAQANPGKLSNVLAQEIPALEGHGVWDAIQLTVDRAFAS